MDYKGAIHGILEDVYAKACTGYMSDVKKRIMRLQLALKTGLNLGDFGPDSKDKREDIEKLLVVVRGPEVGLDHYEFKF
jgi:hypothetical protein